MTDYYDVLVPRLPTRCSQHQGRRPSSYGARALESNTTGHRNTASGGTALNQNTTGYGNTASGYAALWRNTTGRFNTASGTFSLNQNTTGVRNTASGAYALSNNRTGVSNTATGMQALMRTMTGYRNLALGFQAGSQLTRGSNNIYLSHPGAATESNTMRLGQRQTQTFISGIAGVPVSGAAVLISSPGQLGIQASSARYKRDIEPLGARSQGVYQLRPVTFRYTQDPHGARQYGLIAEEVATVYPELVTRNAHGKVESIRYQELTPLLLNALQHQQRQLGTQTQELTVQAKQLAELQAQNARLQSTVVQQQEQAATQQAQLAAVVARQERLEAAAARAAAQVSR